MSMKNLLSLTAVAVLLAVILPVGAAQAQTEMPVSYNWTAPTSGTAVEFYVVEHSVNGGPWTPVGTVDTNSYTLNATVGESHRVRVAGVDAQNRQGPFSLPSEPYSPDAGAPGQPGKPVLF